MLLIYTAPSTKNALAQLAETLSSSISNRAAIEKQNADSFATIAGAVQNISEAMMTLAKVVADKK